MIGKTDLDESGHLHASTIMNWIPHALEAERCMDMVIGPYCAHARIFFRRTKTGDGQAKSS
jgi:hypothetical protein